MTGNLDHWPTAADRARRARIERHARTIRELQERPRDGWPMLYTRASDIAAGHAKHRDLPADTAHDTVTHALEAGTFTAGSVIDLLYVHEMREPAGRMVATPADISLLARSVVSPGADFLEWVWVRRPAYLAWCARCGFEPLAYCPPRAPEPEPEAPASEAPRFPEAMAMMRDLGRQVLPRSAPQAAPSLESEPRCRGGNNNRRPAIARAIAALGGAEALPTYKQSRDRKINAKLTEMGEAPVSARSIRRALSGH